MFCFINILRKGRSEKRVPRTRDYITLAARLRITPTGAIAPQPGGVFS